MIGFLPGRPARSATAGILLYLWGYWESSMQTRASRARADLVCARGRRPDPPRFHRQRRDPHDAPTSSAARARSCRVRLRRPEARPNGRAWGSSSVRSAGGAGGGREGRDRGRVGPRAAIETSRDRVCDDVLSHDSLLLGVPPGSIQRASPVTGHSGCLSRGSLTIERMFDRVVTSRRAAQIDAAHAFPRRRRGSIDLVRASGAGFVLSRTRAASANHSRASRRTAAPSRSALYRPGSTM